MTDKIFGSDFTDETNPQPAYTISVNTGLVLVDVALNYLISAVTHNSTSKTTPVDGDELALVDSAASNVLKKLTWANLKATITTALGAMIATLAGKATPVDGDLLVIADSAASNASKSLTWANVKATLKTYLDTLYVGLSDKIYSGFDGFGDNYVITPSVASNNLTVALKGLNGADPSASNPLKFRVGDTEYSLTAAMSYTKNAGTNWHNAGSSELNGNPIDFFLYAIGETGASAGLKFGHSRIAHALNMGDFVNTTTNEKYIAGNWTNFNATDKVSVIGRFRAQLSASAAFNWSIATAKVINRPIFETDILVWVPTVTSTGGTYTTITKTCTYKIAFDKVYLMPDIFVTNHGTATGNMILTRPIANSVLLAAGGRENNATGKMVCGYAHSSGILINFYDGTTVWVDNYEPNVTILAFI